MLLTTNFDLSEFQSASDGPLTASQTAKARRFAQDLLQPARDAVGFPISITSFVRYGADAHAASRPHANGDAVDFAPTSRAQDDYRQLMTWLAENKRGSYGELLYEVTPLHLHMTLPGFAGDYGQTLQEVAGKPDTFTAWLGTTVRRIADSVQSAVQNGGTPAVLIVGVAALAAFLSLKD